MSKFASILLVTLLITLTLAAPHTDAEDDTDCDFRTVEKCETRCMEDGQHGFCYHGLCHCKGCYFRACKIHCGALGMIGQCQGEHETCECLKS